ncbi:putative Ig domain-containing protein [Cellvibrio sp. KY-YJ-3]|uniref:putative Ig domain-containing protein n=1 Tax=Cellvibrio sp. KY-YJ-3 TaxID=454662 RepID=UPI0012443E30|nr:putative Ig domain-containing protein [Cellvibrio sp. KY-YJ-3]QEY13627.1 DUF4347 domain-containing protein [Cellvibrio sp. KY-YJ-3]
MSKLSRHKRPLIETLEPRLLFSATADIAVFDDGSADITQLSEAAAKLDLTAIYLPPADSLLDEQTAAQRITSLVVVDTAVENYKQLVEDIRQQHSTGDLEIVYLDANSDGVVQIAQQLTQFSQLDSLHIISHGANGSVALGSTLLSTNNLFEYEDELIAWRTALGENADILIYGCDVAATVQGREFIAELAALTDADVAASDDATGHNTLSGDWDLEFSVGNIEQTVVVSTAVQEAWLGVLASTHYINIQGGTSVQSVSSVSGVGQSFLYDSPGATYTVNQISVQLRVESGAANQDITIQLLDGGWNDASPLATQTINSDQLDSTFGWKTFNFGDVVLNDNQTYIIKITTNNADGKVSVAYKSDAWNNSEMIVNGTGNSSADLNFLLSYNNGSNQAPVNTVPGAQSTNQNTPLIFSSIYGNQIQVADADAFPNDLEVTLNAAQGSFSLAQTTGLTFIGGDGTNDFYMLFRGSVAEINAALSTITYTPVNNFVGGDTFSITTKDLGLSGGLQDTDNIAITINNVNDAPTVVIAETSYAVDEQALLDLHGTGIVINDSDGDTLTVTVEAPSTYSQLTALVGTTGVIISSGNTTNVLTLTGTSTQLNNLFAGNNGGTLTYRLAGDTPSATQQLTISASDGSLSANDSALINITAINDPVTLANPIVNQIATEESLFSFTFAADTFADVDGDLLTYTATLANGDALPAWLHFNAGTRTFSGVPDDGDVGFISVKVTANDGNGSTADDTFDITINGVNDDPFVNIPVPNQNATEDSVFTYIFPANTFGDGDVGATFSYTAELADGGALPAWLNFDSATRTFSGTPTNSDVGTISVKLIANDGAGGTANDVFDVVIANTNDAPTVANPIGNQTATESALFNYTFPINAFSDQDLGDSLTYSATLAGGGALPGWLSFDSATRTFSGTPSNGDVGTISISVTADDGEATVSDTFDVVIGNVDNFPFLITPIPNQNATEDAAFNFQFDNATFDDPDAGDTLTYTATMADGSALPAWLSFDAVTRTFSGTPANADVGTISIRVTADDGNGGTPATDTFDLVVANTNDAPTVANPIPNANATEDAAFNFTFAANTFADQDVGNALTYSAQTGGGGALPVWLNFDGATRTFSGTPTNAHVGAISIDVIANDGNGGTVTDTFSITVANTNDVPILANAIPNQNATEDSAFNFQFNSNTFSDVDVSDTLTYSAQLAGGSALPAWLSFDPVTRTFSGTPLNAHVGTVSIEVIADDGNGGSVTDTFTITVANTNDAPSVTITATDYFADEQTPIDLHGTGISVADVDGDALTITLTAEGSNSNLAATVGTTGVVIVSGVNTNTLVLTGTAAQLNDLFAGNGGSTLTYRLSGDTPVVTRMLTISANDGSLSGSDTATINITALNDAPENTVPGGQVTSEDTSLVFSSVNGNRIQIDDLDVGAGNLQVTLSVTNGTLTLGGTTGLIFTTGDGTNDSSLVFSGTKTDINNALSILTFNPTTGYNGTAVLAITTSDLGNSGSGGVLIDSDIVNITITAVNDAPTVANTVPNQNTAEDSAFNFQFNSNTFADSDVGDTLTYTAQLAGGGALPAWLNFDPLTRTFSGTPANGDVGTVSIDVIADDGNGGTVTDTFNIVVANTNDAPIVANTIPNQNTAEDSTFNFQFNINTFADSDVGDTLTYTAQLAGGGALPAWLSFDPVTRTFSGTPANGDVGTVSIDVITNDGNGGTATDTFNIVVANTNDAPTVANVIPDQNATEDSAFNFQFNSNTFADADVGDTLTYTAQLAGGGALPAWLNFDPLTRTFSGTPANGDVGAVSIDVIADDGNGGTVTDTFNVVVANTNDAPIVANTIPNQNTAEDSAFNFQFNSNTFADADVGDTLTYTAQLAGGGALPAWLSFDPVTRTFSGTPANGDVGTVSIDVIADDGNGGIVTDTFNISVANTNDAPAVANVIPDQNATEDSAFNFQFNSNTFADSDVGDTLTYTAQLAGGGALPAWLSYDPVTRTFSGIPTNGDIGTVSIDVIADDGNGGTATDTFNIVVANTNDAPTVANVIPDQNATEDSAFNFQFNSNTFADSDVGDTLTYTAQLAGGGALPAWLSFDPVTRTFSGTPTNGDVGAILIDVIANDGNSAVTDTFMITVVNVNDAPTAITINNMTMVAGEAPQQIDLRNKFFDIEDVVTLNFELMGNSNPDAVIDVQMDQNTGMMTIVVSSENAGESIIRLRAIDSDGAWVESSFKVTVSAKEPPVAPPVIIPPVIVAPPIITPDVDETTPPTIPDPIIPPVVVLPETQNPGVIPPTHGDESTLSPALPDEPDITSEVVDQELLVNGDEYDSPYNVVEDKSAQDYERVVQLLNSNALQVSSLTASTSLVSLIVPDAGFAPWEAAEFDSEVRRIRAQMDEALEEEHDRKALIAGISFSLTTGLLIWSLRASSLLLAMVSMLPLWRGLDPLPILDEVNKRKKELEQQRKDRKHEDKNAKEVGYLFDHAQQKTKDV